MLLFRLRVFLWRHRVAEHLVSIDQDHGRPFDEYHTRFWVIRALWQVPVRISLTPNALLTMEAP